jgi:hypothetical protein
MSRRAARLSDLDSIDDETKCIAVVIETPKASRTKFA